MENSVGYLERLIQKISSDKNKMLALIFSALSVITTIIYMCSVGVSGLHLVFVLGMLVASLVNVLYIVDTDKKNKYADDMLVCGIGALLLGLILKVVRVGISFSVIYFIGYLVYAVAILLLGLYYVKGGIKPILIKVLLLLCAAWSVFEFFSLQSSYISGITWKIFRISEVFLSISYFFLLIIATKSEMPFFEKVGSYKRQIPSLKICISILLVIAIVSGAIGFVLDLGTGSKVVTTNNNTVTEEKKDTVQSTQKKSTVTSTVVPADEKPTEIEELKIGDAVETDSFTFKLNRVELTRRVEPDNPPSYYTYYQAESAHTYIYVNASVTNKEKFSLESDEIYSVTAYFDGGYEYKGFNIADDNDGDFTYANITSIDPLETLGVHCLLDCPEQVEEEGKSLYVIISLKNGSKYKYIIK